MRILSFCPNSDTDRWKSDQSDFVQGWTELKASKFKPLQFTSTLLWCCGMFEMQFFDNNSFSLIFSKWQFKFSWLDEYISENICQVIKRGFVFCHKVCVNYLQFYSLAENKLKPIFAHLNFKSYELFFF